jgi:hypothetical protein
MRTMRASLTCVGLLLLAVAKNGTAQTRLEGCDDPRETIAALRQLNLMSTEWQNLTERRLIEAWGRPLMPLGGEFLWLSTGGRIIHAETQCAVEFWLRTTREVRPPDVEGLDQVRFIYSSVRRPEVIEVAELLHREWSPPPGAEVIDSQRATWNEAKRRDIDAMFQYEWHIQGRGNASDTVRIMRVSTRVYRLESGWTTAVMLESLDLSTR